jgi:NAD(P)-dependent dehydrogenase (short-subunit alcohol dehydrogenase family)
MPNSSLSTAIVTGAGSGLGRAFALRLARDGWRIALADIDEAGSQETLRQVVEAGGEGFSVRLDVTDPAAWQSLSQRLRAEWTHLDLLVNNAGIGAAGEIDKFPLEYWRRLVDVNLMGGVYGCHTFVDWLKQRPGKAHIINIASFAAIASAPGMAAYNVSKAGMLSLSESLYTELKPHGVGVTVVCPVFFKTNLLKNSEFMPESSQRIAARYMEKAGFSADDVAEQAMKAMAKKKLFLLMGRKVHMFWRTKRWFPTWFLDIVSSGYQRKMAKAEADRKAEEE